MSRANPLWGAPHIHGELLKLGFEVAQSTVAPGICPPLTATISRLAHVSEQQPCRRHRGGRPFCPSNDRVPHPLLSCRWLPASGDEFGCRFSITETADCGVDFAPDHRGVPMGPRRRDTSFGIGTPGTGHPSCGALARHRDSRSADSSDHPGKTLTLSSFTGSIRRECLDDMIVFGQAHLRRILGAVYARSTIISRGTHRSLNKTAPLYRAIERIGAIKSHTGLGGLHHQYCRI